MIYPQQSNLLVTSSKKGRFLRKHQPHLKRGVSDIDWKCLSQLSDGDCDGLPENEENQGQLNEEHCIDKHPIHDPSKDCESTSVGLHVCNCKFNGAFDFNMARVESAYL